MMTSLIWWAKCCHPYLWLQFPILISALNVWLSISIFKIKIDKLASQNQNSIFKIMLWVVNIKIQIQDSKVAYQDWYSTSTFASLLGNIQYQNQNRSRHQIQHQFQEYCQYQHQNQPISIILPTSEASHQATLPTANVDRYWETLWMRFLSRSPICGEYDMMVGI